MMSRNTGAVRCFLFQLRCRVPLWVIGRGTILVLRERLTHRGAQRQKAEAAMAAFRSCRDRHAFDTDWFSANIPLWQRLIAEEGLATRPDLACLEIGSWQGLSALYTLTALPRAQLTCVDTWQGADEHQDDRFVCPTILASVEQRFDENLAPFCDRITKVKSTSAAFYAQTPPGPRYDLIYVDGAHHRDDVMADAIHCFDLLKPGGVMIFDDYCWQHYEKPADNPAGAINAFLRRKRTEIALIGYGPQVAIRKT